MDGGTQGGNAAVGLHPFPDFAISAMHSLVSFLILQELRSPGGLDGAGKCMADGMFTWP